MPTSPQITITVTKTYTVKESEKDAFLSIQGFPVNKPVYDSEGNPTFEEDGTPITEPMTETEYMAEIEKQQMSMSVLREATAKLEEMYGKINYNAHDMLQYLSDNLTVSVEID